MSTPPLTTTKNSMTMLGVVLAAASLAFTYFQILPQYTLAKQEYLNQIAVKEGLDQDVATLQKAQQELNSKKEESKNRGVRLDMIPAVMPNTEEMPSLYLQMENVSANAKNLKEVTYQLSKPVADTNGTVTSGVKIPLTVSAVGKYADILEWINQLEKSTRPISLTNLNFSVNQTADASGNPVTNEINFSASGYARALGLSEGYAPEGTTPATTAPLK